jgi:hypothetical protein
MSAISVLYLEAHFSGNWRSGALFKQMSTVIELFGLFLFMHFRRWGLPLQFLFVLPSINIHLPLQTSAAYSHKMKPCGQLSTFLSRLWTSLSGSIHFPR